ncbi:beta-N-acetylhexosaminidase [Lipingzhangella halophila]|uniref:beta-N-acetylhexosaminidase n=1 Tax=Lipingzhangella halophila TaxID=1783352 RepID=A0A7W7RL02_9ACTN|nr:glycoside hydrolase family 3 protein [Lipingzhangella halophila]MBB4933861.1 beta-N-acetylhexosaminidase [Lipingzhangella halophila]
MLTRRTLAPLAVVLLLLSSACDADGGAGAGAGGGDGESPSPDDAARVAEELLADMDLDEKVGQTMVLTAQGTTAEENAGLIEEHHPGGFIYFSENLEDAEQIAELSNGLQEQAAGNGTDVPLFLGIDQEQGMVSRLPVGTRFPDAMAVGASRDPEMARSRAGVTARELGALGINLDYAPVADVNVNAANPVIGIRSFGSDPELVSEMALAEAGAFEEDGVVPVMKHFPGHGDTDVDSHTGLPRVEKSRDEWEKVDLPPFESAVEENVDAIMTAHVFLPELDDSGEPSTLSDNVINGVLRDELGYDGVVTTDALNMEGVRQTHDDGEIAVRALEAGADQLLMPPDAAGAADAVRAAVDEGRISEDRLDESVRRILELKVRRGLLDAEPVDTGAAAGTVGSAENEEAAQEVADASVTLLRNEDDVLPLDSDAAVSVSGAGAEEISAALEELGYQVTGSAGDADVAVVGTEDARSDPEQAAPVEAAASAGTPVVVVAQGTPYDIEELPDADGYLATYSAVDVSRTAAARALAGEVDPTGKLPVDIPGTDLEYGDGLEY